MPTIEDYASLAPFTLEELVAAVNAVLRDRPTLHVQPRTIRYYISSGLLSSPSGGPKHARYGLEHLRRIVAIRQWLDLGISLEQAAERIQMGEHGGETETPMRRQSMRAPVRERSQGLFEEHTIRRFVLSKHSVLEIDSRADVQEELLNAVNVIQSELEKFI